MLVHVALSHEEGQPTHTVQLLVRWAGDRDRQDHDAAEAAIAVQVDATALRTVHRRPGRTGLVTRCGIQDCWQGDHAGSVVQPLEVIALHTAILDL